MSNRRFGIVAITLLLGSLTLSSASAEEFIWIMSSISGAGSISNGDGHYWGFRNAGDGEWEVKGAYAKVATVTSAGENKVELSGFPYNWRANGEYDFSRSSGECVLDSDHSEHKLKWSC